MDLQMCFQVKIRQASEDRDGAVRVGVGIYHFDDIGFADRGYFEISPQTLRSLLDGHGMVLASGFGPLLAPIQPTLGDHSLEQIVARQQLDLGIDLGFADLANIAGAAVSIGRHNHVGALVFHQYFHPGFVLLRHQKSTRDHGRDNQHERDQDLPFAARKDSGKVFRGNGFERIGWHIEAHPLVTNES
ncbi:MAG: hypothetical protein ABSH56_07675 [Bryobacteraceae bacterium]